MKTKQGAVFTVALFALSIAVLVPLQAQADSVQLTLLPVSGLPGSTVTVSGTIINNSSTTVYLNGENFTLSSPSFLNGDTNDFFLNAPVSLDPGTNSGSIALFVFDVASGAPAGMHSGNYLDIIGGGPSDFTHVLVSSQFSVDVQSASPVPEPSVPMLMLVGSLVAGTYLRSKQNVKAG